MNYNLNVQLDFCFDACMSTAMLQCCACFSSIACKGFSSSFRGSELKALEEAVKLELGVPYLFSKKKKKKDIPCALPLDGEALFDMSFPLIFMAHFHRTVAS